MFQTEIQMEELIFKDKGHTPLCDVHVCVGSLSSEPLAAVFLCLNCEMYVCAHCEKDHKKHDGVKLGSGGILQRLGNLIDGKNKRRKIAEKIFDEIMHEKDRREQIKQYKVAIYDRVKVTHELDKRDESTITGLCILDNKMWVVCDPRNHCNKVFKLGSNVLQRYLRFRCFPFDVTEIHLKQNCSQQDKQCLLGVTLPTNFQILIIDLNEKPALILNTLDTEEPCFTIHYHDDKIFTICSGGRYLSPWSVYIKSTNGDTLNRFETDIRGRFKPHLAVGSGRVYLTSRIHNKVQCRNFEGEVIAEITIAESDLHGISVDHDNNIYVCARDHNTVYKLDPNLNRYDSVLDQSSGYVQEPGVLFYYKKKLYLNNNSPPPSRNFVTVARLM